MSGRIGILDYFLNKIKDTPKIKDVKDTLEIMEEYSNVFQIGLELQNKKDLARKVSTARQKINSVKGMLGKVDDWGKYALATSRIISAMRSLKTAPDIRKDPMAQAKAFEQMFVAFGTFCDLSPFTKPYAPFFASFNGFFTNVGGALMIGGGPNTERGKILADIMNNRNGYDGM